MPSVDIKPRALQVLRSMAGNWADAYVDDIMLPSLQNALGARTRGLEDVKAGFTDPYRCLQGIFCHYAFARRGKDRSELADLAVTALRRAVGETGFARFLALPDAHALWDSYVKLCEERKRKPMEQLN